MSTNCHKYDFVDRAVLLCLQSQEFIDTQRVYYHPLTRPRMLPLPRVALRLTLRVKYNHGLLL